MKLDSCLSVLFLFSLLLVFADAQHDAGVPGSCIDDSKSEAGFFMCWNNLSPPCQKILAYQKNPFASNPPIAFTVKLADSAMEFLNGLAVYAKYGGTVESVQRAMMLLTAYTAMTPPSELEMTIHTDEARLQVLQGALGAVLDPIDDAPALSDDARSQLLSYLLRPNLIGNGMVSRVLNSPEQYGLSRNITMYFVAAFFNYMWSKTSIPLQSRRVMYRINAANQFDTFVPTVNHQNCEEGKLITPVRWFGHLFSQFVDADNRRRENLAAFFASQSGISAGMAPKFLEELNTLEVYQMVVLMGDAQKALAAAPLAPSEAEDGVPPVLDSAKSLEASPIGLGGTSNQAQTEHLPTATAFWVMTASAVALLCTAVFAAFYFVYLADRDRKLSGKLDGLRTFNDDISRKVIRQDNTLADLHEEVQSTNIRIAALESQLKASGVQDSSASGVAPLRSKGGR